MVDLAARRSLGTHPFLVTPDYCAKTRSVIGKHNLLAPYLPVVLTNDRDVAHAAAGPWLGQFIGMPSYNSCLRTQGFTDADLLDGPSERLIDALTAWGDLDAIAARVGAYHDAGANHVALHVLGASTDYPRRQWRELGRV
jgi:probable F420-dependent oxidoreductase